MIASLIALAAVVARGAAASNASLVARYSFDDGTASEASDGSLDGTIRGAAATAGWDGDGALAFDGDDAVDFPAAATADVLGGSPRTACVWARLDDFDHGALFTYGSYVEDGEFGLLTFDDDAHVRVQFYGDASLATYVALDGADDGGWHHYCVAYDSATWALYFDGSLARDGAAALDTGADQRLRLGERAKDGFGLLGALDELRLYAGALSAGDVCALANATACGESDDDVLVGASKKSAGGSRVYVAVSVFAAVAGLAVFAVAGIATNARPRAPPPAAARPYPPAPVAVAAAEPYVPMATAYAVGDADADATGGVELPAMAILRGKAG